MNHKLLRWILRPSLLRRVVTAIVCAAGLAWLIFLGMVLMSSFPLDGGYIAKDLKRWSEGFLVTTVDEENPEHVQRRAGQIFQMLQQSMSESGVPAGSIHPVVQIWARNRGLLYANTDSIPLPLGKPLTGISTLYAQDTEWLVSTFVRPDEEVWTVVALNKGDQYALFWGFFRQMLPTWLGSLALLLAFSAFAARRGLLPLQYLAKVVSKRSLNDLSDIQTVQPYAETDPLVGEINRLLSKARENISLHRHFLADAAHELRTPLTALRAQVHVLEHARSEGERFDASKELDLILIRTAEVVNQLLTVARIDDPFNLPEKRVSDLHALLQRVAAQTAARYLQLEAELVFESAGPLPVQIFENTITVAVENLLENALRYGGKGVRVRLSLVTKGESIRILVQDDGVGVPKAHQKHLFRRFYRVPGTGASGSGLGLAIVRQVAEIHGGTAELVEGLSATGFGVEIKLPLGLLSQA